MIMKKKARLGTSVMLAIVGAVLVTGAAMATLGTPADAGHGCVRNGLNPDGYAILRDVGLPSSRSEMILSWISLVPSKILVNRASRQ